MFKGWNKTRTYVITTTLAFLILLNGVFHVDREAIEGDAGQYVTMAYNLSKYGELSLHGYQGEDEVSNPSPTAYREPGFPAYLAFFKGVTPRLRAANLKTLLSAGPIRWLKYSQVIVILLTALLTAHVVSALTQEPFLSYAALSLVGFSSSMLTIADKLYSENFVALLVVSLAYILYKVFETKASEFFLLLGLILGFLVLSRAIFMYFVIFAIALLIYALLKKHFSYQTFFVGITVFLLSYSLIVGPYMLRNFHHFGEATLSGRGGVVLLIRANINRMNFTEFVGSFIVWTPDEEVKRLGARLFGENYRKEGGKLERLSRIRGSQSFYRKARDQRSELVKASNLPRENNQVNNQLKEAALEQIAAHPLKHLVVTLPIAWRGLFVEEGFSLKIPLLPLSVNSPTIISLLYFASLAYTAFLSVKEKSWQMFALILPALFLYGIHSLLTHNIPRFNAPLIPIFIITLLVQFHRFFWQQRSPQLPSPKKI